MAAQLDLTGLVFGEVRREVWAEVRARRAQALAALTYLWTGLGVLWLVSAIGADSGTAYDTVEQSTNAAIGVGLLGVSLPFGVTALVLDVRDARAYAAGQAPWRLASRRRVVGTLLLSVGLMAGTLWALAG